MIYPHKSRNLQQLFFCIERLLNLTISRHHKPYQSNDQFKFVRHENKWKQAKTEALLTLRLINKKGKNYIS
jgi:hypothetical protein